MDLATVSAAAISRPSSGITSPITRHSRSRTQSISSDRPSTISYSLMSPPLSISPEAAFIAASAASQIVTNDHDSHADRWYDEHGVEPSGETALLSPAALNLVNNFLDQLLFNFLCIAKSTSLTSLRPAVSEVLKPKLAKDVVNLADEELREYLGSGDDDDILQTPTDPGSDWDLELVWKRTRLRCMVYSSLGDMEEEDEDYYMDQDQLEDTGRCSDVVSPAVAIFLTSILEFMGEQALIVAGQAAYHRIRVKHEKELKEELRSPSPISDRIVVEELDMERVALDRTLGRLWRAWKKRIRSPGLDHHGLQRAFSRSSMRSGSFHAAHLRQESTLVDHELRSPTKSATRHKSAQDGVEAWVYASQIPLPMRDSDVDEIEVPGLTWYSDDEDESGEEEEEETGFLDVKPRPKSLVVFPIAMKDLPTPLTSQPVTPVAQTRKRSNSLPSVISSYRSHCKRSKVEQKVPTQLVSDDPFVTAPISTEEISPKALAADKSPEEEAAMTTATATATATAQMEDERKPGAVLSKPRILNRRPIASAAASTQPGQAKETHDPAELIEGDIDEFTEEPEVLNLSRVSVAGRISPTSRSDSPSGSKPQPIDTGLPVRTPSIHSARLVDVTAPRSPRSRQGSTSVDSRHSQDHHHTAVVVLPPASIANNRVTPNVSRTNSYSSQPPIVEGQGVQAHPEQRTVSPISRAAAPSPLSREVAPIASPLDRSSSRQSRTTTVLPPRDDTKPLSRKPLPGQAVTTPTKKTAQPIYGSTSRQSPQSSPRGIKQASSPTHPASPAAPTKVTIINSSHTGTFLDLDERPDVPTKPIMASAQHSRREVRDVLPPVPERSSNRHSDAGPEPQQSIGRLSVDRSVGYGRDSPERSSPDARAGSKARAPGSENSASSSVSGSKFKPKRTSEDSTLMRATVPRDFEELMKSDTTIQYTLTPDNMREMDSQSTRSFSNGSPVIPVKVRKSEDRLSVTRSRSSSDNKSMDLKRSGSVNRPKHLSSHPESDLKGPVPRAPAAGLSSSGRAGGAQARDARVSRDSMADFSKWIRSTGPDGGAASGPAPAMSGAIAGSRNSSLPASASMAKPSVDTNQRVGTSSSGGSNNTTRPKLLARDATISSHDETSDLIDFIRRGPPTTNPRIPRAVAPFRSTMDSDQLAAAVGGKAVDANIPDIRYSGGTTQTAPSVQSSVDSRSALLSSTTKPGRAHGGGAHAAGLDVESGMPKRTRRGPRDPYAIDFDDDDSDADLFDRPPPKPAKKEESLAEFLMNYEPSAMSSSSPPPPPPPAIRPPINKPKKKSSAPSLMARFTRSYHNHIVPSSHSMPHSTTGSANGLDASSISSKATGGSGSGRGYIPIQVHMPHGSETYGNNSGNKNNNNNNNNNGMMMAGTGVGGSSKSNLSVQSGPAAPGGAARRSAAGGRVPMKKFEAREAVGVTSRTNDLADFLKNSGPPPMGGGGGGGGGATSSAPNLDQNGRPQRRRMKF